MSAPGNPRWAAIVVAPIFVMLAAAIAAPVQTFTTLHTFSGGDGEYPYWTLVQATDGNLYGTTPAGGPTPYGTIFKINPSGTLTTLYSFCSQRNCPDGSSPEAGLVQAVDGNLYGTTALGGTYGYGTIFKISLSGTLTTLYNFQETDGSGPYTALIQSNDGEFYGTTCCGGANGFGTVFKMTPEGKLTSLHSFDNLTDGAFPYAALLQAGGKLYGATVLGGPNQGGTIFEITLAGTLTTLYFFCSQTACIDGSNPHGTLVQSPTGDFYGTTINGGTNNFGTVFKFSRSGGLTTLYNFCSQGGCSDGKFPEAPLVQATDRNFYGTSLFGGVSDSGTIFKITPNGEFTSLYSFCSQSGCADGAYPYAGLIQDTNGRLYGVTCGTFCGGVGNGFGTVFSLAVGLGTFIETLPTSGKVGSSVLILGTKLTGATRVTFNGTPAAFTVEAGSVIKATVPAGASTGTAQVVTPSGTLISNVSFRVLP